VAVSASHVSPQYNAKGAPPLKNSLPLTRNAGGYVDNRWLSTGGKGLLKSVRFQYLWRKTFARGQNMSELLVVVALVLQIQNGQPVGTATGFFYTKNDTIYFVTNRHVVIDKTKNIKSDLLKVRLHTDPNDLTKNGDIDIPLYTNGVAKWHIHPDYSTKKIDIAIVEIDQDILKTYYFKALSAAVFLPKQFPLSLGEDVMVIGVPLARVQKTTIRTFAVNSFAVNSEEENEGLHPDIRLYR
jgi:S1-C subfamily serine protease